MRWRYVIVGLGIYMSTPAIAQWWQSAGIPVSHIDGIAEVYEDTATSTMYCVGYLQDSLWYYSYASYYNGIWAISDPFYYNVWSVVIHHDTLIVGGEFIEVNGQSLTYIACNVNGQWLPYGNLDAGVRRLRVIDGELYATGSFIHADGHLCNGVAKRVGGTWVNVGELPDMEAQVQDIIKYNDELYIVGALHFYDLGAHGVARFDGAQWLPAGNGIMGGFAAGLCLEVYQDELYMGGLIDIGAGNPGHAIMRWNGSEWRSVGTGVQGPTGTYDYLYTVNDLSVHNGLLYASGGFSFAGNVPAMYIATWDGDQWCGLGGTFSSLAPIYSHGFLGDTLFVGCYDMADGQPVNGLARYIGTWPDTCSGPMGGTTGLLPQQPSAPAQLVPLGDGQYRYIGTGKPGLLQVHNAMGQVVRSFHLPWAGDASESFRLAGLAPGVYMVGLHGGSRTKLYVQP